MSGQYASAVPAPKTFAPSREDVYAAAMQFTAPLEPSPFIAHTPCSRCRLSTLAFFFGDPATPEKLKDYSEHHAMTYHFPDAFYGQNVSTAHSNKNAMRCDVCLFSRLPSPPVIADQDP